MNAIGIVMVLLFIAMPTMIAVGGFVFTVIRSFFHGIKLGRESREDFKY